MNLLAMFRQEPVAPDARERLQILLAHQGMTADHAGLLSVLREEILTAVARHITVDRDTITIKLDRGDAIATLEIDVEMMLLPDPGPGARDSGTGHAITEKAQSQRAVKTAEPRAGTARPVEDFASHAEAAFRQGARQAVRRAHDAGIPVPVLGEDGRLAWLHPDGVTRPSRDGRAASCPV